MICSGSRPSTTTALSKSSSPVTISRLPRLLERCDAGLVGARVGVHRAQGEPEAGGVGPDLDRLFQCWVVCKRLMISVIRFDDTWAPTLTEIQRIPLDSLLKFG